MLDLGTSFFTSIEKSPKTIAIAEIDNEIKAGQKRLKELRQEKKQVTSVLVEVMKQNEIDCFDINDGKLVYKQNKQNKILESSLERLS